MQRLDKFVGRLLAPISNRVVDNIPVRNTNLEDFVRFVSGKTIALVGNSPILDGSSFGNKIDSHDIVVRMNAGILPRVLNPRDTGQRMNLWSVGAVSCLRNKEVVHAYMQVREQINFTLCAIPDTKLTSFHPSNQLFAKYFFYGDTKTVFIPGDAFLQLQNNLRKVKPENNYSPSTGFRTISELLRAGARSIDLFGFSFNTEHRILEAIPMHQSKHDFCSEENIIRSQEKVTVHST